MYTTVEKIENYLLKEIDLSFHDQIDEWIAYAKEYIDLKTNNEFGEDEDEEVPATISLVATILVSGIINHQLKEGEIASEKIGNYQVSYTAKQKKDFENIDKLLEPYRNLFL